LSGKYISGHIEQFESMHWFTVLRAASIGKELKDWEKFHLSLSLFLILVGIAISFLTHFSYYEGSLGHIFMFLF